MSLVGGYRSYLIMFVLMFCVQFYLEGAHRTRLLPVLLGGLLLFGIVSLPFLRQFPLSIQRSLAFLPLPVDAGVRANAEASSEWRINIWKAVLPQVPQYLLLGKGLAMTHEELDYSVEQQSGAMRAVSADQDALAVSGDYHNGPLSVIIQFGIWGVVVFLWLIGAGIRVLYRNYRYGDPELRIVNSCLLALFVAKVLVFLFVYGGASGDVQIFVGYVGLGVSLNGGMAKPVPEPVPEPAQASGLPDLLPRPRTAMGR
jgi:O-antigen ligase